MRISLIITTYNKPDALLLVLRSVELQTLTPHGVIIADDGSDDDTKDTILSFQKTSDLNIIHSWQKDNGFRAAKSRNKAIAKSSGNYIILIDGDMILHPEFIKDHISNAEKGYFVQGTRALLTKGATKNTLEKMNINFSFFSQGIQNRKNTICSNFLSRLFSKKKNYLRGIKTCNMAFFKQDCININGFNNDFEGWGREDSEFIVRLLNSGINRKNLRFNAIQYHLWHNENTRESLQQNNTILKNVIDNNVKWCVNGISRYL
ncbi:Putative two-domain glycosyltransferase [uncultured Gammaproteobacteria bacterium]|nr:Putative two-domain glycosyltransferase [uncultured Gammaproteobacteria bacterium]